MNLISLTRARTASTYAGNAQHALTGKTLTYTKKLRCALRTSAQLQKQLHYGDDQLGNENAANARIL
jgi:hypothetical protein